MDDTLSQYDTPFVPPILAAPGTDPVVEVANTVTAPAIVSGAVSSNTLGAVHVSATAWANLYDIDGIETSDAVYWTTVDSFTHSPVAEERPAIVQWGFRVTGITGTIIGQPDYMGVYYRVLRDGTQVAFEGPLPATVGLPSKVKDWYLDTNASGTKHTYTVEVAVLSALPQGSVRVSSRSIAVLDL